MYHELLLHIDHFSTFPNTNDLETYLKTNYEDMGFIMSDRFVKQDPGLTSRFILLTGEYLEFNIVEDKSEFNDGKKSSKDLIDIYEEHRPYSIGYMAQNIEEMYEHWRVRGYQVEDVSYVVPRDKDTTEIEPEQDPTWTYIPFPSTFAQGTKSYVIEYKKREKKDQFRFIMGENGIYGVNGVTFVTDYPDNRGQDWSNFFYSKNKHIPYLNECTMQILPHFIQWITPQKFNMIYKSKFYPSKSSVGELYVIHLLTKDLKYTKEDFESKGKIVTERNLRVGNEKIESILVERNQDDGFLFAISERDPEEWLKWRQSKVNEIFE